MRSPAGETALRARKGRRAGERRESFAASLLELLRLLRDAEAALPAVPEEAVGLPELAAPALELLLHKLLRELPRPGPRCGAARPCGELGVDGEHGGPVQAIPDAVEHGHPGCHIVSVLGVLERRAEDRGQDAELPGVLEAHQTVALEQL